MKAISTLVLLLGIPALTADGITFNAALDFSHTGNPNGPWSYGWDDGAFHSMNQVQQIAPSVYFWQGDLNGPLDEPTLGKNEGTSVLLINGSTTYAPGIFAMHPGRLGQKAVLRWTAPFAGAFSVAAQFKGLDAQTTTDATIREGGSILSSGLVNGFSRQLNYFDTLNLDQNDTIEFLLGYGSNNAFYFDTTRVDVLITDALLTTPPVFPDPVTAGLPVYPLNFSEAGPPPYEAPVIIYPSIVPETGNALLLFGISSIALEVARRRQCVATKL